jgi:membrane-bound lytic murein transglycosylase MltF
VKLRPLACLLMLSVSGTASLAVTSPAAPAHHRDSLPLLGEPQARPEAVTGDLDAIRARRQLRVLVPYGRYTFFFENGEPHGYVHDLFREYEKSLNAGVPLTARVQVVFIPVPRDLLLPWLMAGRGDVATGRLTITPRRLAQVDFSAPIRSNVAEIAVTRKGTPAPRVPEDLSGRTVHVRKSSAYYPPLLRLNDRLRAAGRPPVKIVAADEFLEDEDLLERLSDGLIEATLLDDDALGLMAQAFPNLEFHRDVRLREGTDFGWAIRKGSPKLKASLDAFIADAKRGQGLLNQLERRYFVDNRWVRRAPSPAAASKFLQLRGLFVESASEFDLEWVALLSQGYQESGLDHSVKSRVGAVGLMQLMPTTASAAPISLPDIHRPDVNVRAGAKYMRYLMDTYFAEPGLPAAERLRFALAAYNAGPNRVRKLRELTAKAGLDPAVWYGNVEILTARHVGQETVTYVANIEKYLMAFRRSLEIEQARRPAKAR